MGVIDGSLPLMLGAVVEITVSMFVKLGGTVLFSTMFLFPGVLIGILGAYIGNIYLKAQMSVKREMRYVLPPLCSPVG